MNPQIACLVTSPTLLGGTETSMQHTLVGMHKIGVDAEALAVRLSKRSPWTKQSEDLLTPVDRRELVDKLSGFDGVILNNVAFFDRYIPEVISNPDVRIRHLKLTSGWHRNDITPAAAQAHELVKSSPLWTGKYVRFWPEPLKDDDVKWVSTTLPYTMQKDDATDSTPLALREYDLGFIGRVDPRKGTVGFVVAVHDIVQRMKKKVRVLLAGAPIELPGGPYIHVIRTMLEQRGWKIDAADTTMKSTWVAQLNGSEIHYTGGYNQQELWKHLDSTKVFVNMTSLKASRDHLEYTTLEAIDARCAVIASDSVPDGSYAEKPKIFAAPESTLLIRKGARTVFNDVGPTADETYRPMVEQMLKVLQEIEGNDSIDWLESNREVIRDAHDPSRAASAYIEALNLA